MTTRLCLYINLLYECSLFESKGPLTCSAKRAGKVSWIWIRDTMISWIRIRIHLQMTNLNVWNISLFGHFFKVLSLYLEARSRIRIKVTKRIRIQVTSRIRNSTHNTTSTCMVVKEGAEQRQHVRYLSSTLFAFNVLPGSVNLVLLLLVEGAKKTACPIPLFNSLNIRHSLNPDPDTDPIWIQGFDNQKFQE
jgi:hypothetical protein